MNPPPVDGWSMMQRANELAGQGVEFALATVVWRRAPSSAQQGGRAIITADGQIHGWIGGACAEPVVIREARRAIEDRQPRLILLGAPDEFDDAPEGMVFVQMACQSEGAAQLYIEPVVPTPELVVVGRSPMAATLVDLAAVLGWRSTLVEAADFLATDVAAGSVVVVATQGHGDEDAIEHAVAGTPGFVGMVASRKRGEAVLGYLADRGVPEDRLAAVRVPVGLDLGHTSHREIAVAVLAELVQLRAGGALERRPPGAPTAPAESEPTGEAPGVQPSTAVDVVCGMTVPADDTSRPLEHEGVTYYFCCPGCRAAFEESPADFTSEAAQC
jgi:xanthine dehydrogenase accessory factor